MHSGLKRWQTCMPSPRNLVRGLYLFLAAASLLPHSPASGQSPRTVAYQFSHAAIMDPTLSPDGKEMIYIMVIAGREQLMRRAVDGSYVRQLTSDDAGHEDPAWSPDGSRVAFVRIKNELEQIQLMNPDGTGIEPLTPAAVKTIHPSWSPDGHRVVYCTDDDLAPPRKNPSEIYSIDIATRSITKLISDGVNTYPVWSPDGKMMAFRRMLGETNSEVFVADADGSNPRNITNNPAFDGWPAWSPDGSRSHSPPIGGTRIIKSIPCVRMAARCGWSPLPKDVAPPRSGRPMERQSTSRYAGSPRSAPTVRFTRRNSMRMRSTSTARGLCPNYKQVNASTLQVAGRRPPSSSLKQHCTRLLPQRSPANRTVA